MANILCFVEQHASELTPSSLEILGQARRLGTTLGATVYAALALERAPGYGEDDVLAKLASAGADKVLLLVGEAFGATGQDATWETHGAAVIAAWDVSQPAIMLIPSVGCGRELAARAAARVGAAYLHEAFAEVVDDALVLAEPVPGGTRRLPVDVDYPVVATIPPGRYSPAVGDDEAEVEVLQVSAVVRFASEPDGEGAPPVRATVSDRDGVTLVELDTGKGCITIAAGATAKDVDADFSIAGDAKVVVDHVVRAS